MREVVHGTFDGAEAHTGSHRSAGLATVVVLTLILAGVALRLVHIDQPPLAYQGTRAYHSALIARDFAQLLGADANGLDRSVVTAASPREIEPPLLEGITAATWRVVDAEPLWVPRVLTILAWAVGGWCLYLLLRRMASVAGGVAGITVWTFLPFATTTSRTFQPDPAMVACVVAAILALVVEDDEPTRRRLATAAALSGLAVFIKLPAAFFVIPVFASLTVRRFGWRGLWTRRSATYALGTLGPALLWNLYGFTLGGFLRGQDGHRTEPGLLVDARFWRGWVDLGLRSFGVLVPLAALIGIVIARGRARWVGVALLVGYVSFGATFTYHAMTHDYYHLPLMIILAIGVGLLADRLWSFVRVRQADALSLTVTIATCAVVVAGFAHSTEPVRFPLVPEAIPAEALAAEYDAPRVAGELVHHSAHVVFLAPNFGLTLMYYGGIAGTPWPDGDDARAALAELRADGEADFFVITDPNALESRPELRRALRPHPLIASEADLLVYDLRPR